MGQFHSGTSPLLISSWWQTIDNIKQPPPLFLIISSRFYTTQMAEPENHRALRRAGIGSRKRRARHSRLCSRSWMARLSVSLAADAIRCLRGRQDHLDTRKHTRGCRVLRCSVCVCSAYIMGKSLFSRFRLCCFTLKPNRPKCSLFACQPLFIIA